MLLLIISAVLVIGGAVSWNFGSYTNKANEDTSGQLWIIIGIIAVIIGLVLAVITLVTMLRKSKLVPEKPSKREVNVKRLVLTSILLALGSALSLVKIWQMPLGGSITLLSMLPIALISIEYGIGWGLTSAFTYSLIQMALDLPAVLSWGLSPTAVFGTVALDYILAFTALGLAGLFRRKKVLGICIGVFIALCLRFICHVISGTIIFDIWMPDGWSSPLWYSICYNGAFMLPETIITIIGTVVLFKLPHFNKLVESNLE